jgi:Leucine-rich repeat (LRR) protein
MCYICDNKQPINGIINCSHCTNITTDMFKSYIQQYEGKITKLICVNTSINEIPNIIGLKELWCSYSNITEIPHIVGLKKLYCTGTNITEIPHIEGMIYIECIRTKITKIPNIIGLKRIYCSYTNITEIPNIEGCNVQCFICYWLNNRNRQLVTKTQKMIRNYFMRKKLVQIRDQLMPIYFHPEMKGGYLHKKSMLDMFL